MSKSQARRAKYSSVKDIDMPNLNSRNSQGMFVDPRGSRDRRKRTDTRAIPKTGCRRNGDRRTTVYMKTDEWWMKRNYNNGD